VITIIAAIGSIERKGDFATTTVPHRHSSARHEPDSQRPWSQTAAHRCC